MRADKEKRRAISREAARRRRRVESDVFGDLSRLLPLQPSVRAHLDKPSIIRLTLSYMRTRSLFRDCEASRAPAYERAVAGVEQLWGCDRWREEKWVESGEASEEADMYLNVLQGFLMVLSSNGDMIFLSDNVSKHMGLTQTELMGHNIFEFTHPEDHEEIKSNLRLTADEVCCGVKRDVVMRVKSALSHRGRNATFKSATWKVLHCRGRAKVRVSPTLSSCLLLTCTPLPLTHTLLSTHTFTSQHSMDLRITHCDQRVTVLLGYRPEELLGRSVYDLCHPLDYEYLRKNHTNLCLKTQSVTGQYRMLVKGGGYVWAETHSAVIPNNRANKFKSTAQQQPCVLSITYVLSGVEQPSLQLSLDQAACRY
ncbi:endothelial PAS domain-containing protein 1 [Nelusetta ayraudi]|uniref:endothelial PAS domain-containing protein 1 n=1 Tax=Nelusetta ayraudi TaxID=303726 RepID=UPI003F6F29CE